MLSKNKNQEEKTSVFPEASRTKKPLHPLRWRTSESCQTNHFEISNYRVSHDKLTTFAFVKLVMILAYCTCRRAVDLYIYIKLLLS